MKAEYLADFVNKLVAGRLERPVTKRNARQLLHFYGYTWKKLKNGYYKRKMVSPEVVEHRDEYIVLAEAFHLHPKIFRFVSTDEVGFRTGGMETSGWCLTPMDEYDASSQSGVGIGYNMLNFLATFSTGSLRWTI